MVPLNNYSSISIFVTPVSIRYMWYITTCLSKCYLFSVIKMCSIKIECTFEDTFKISKQCEKTLFTYIIYVCIDSLIVVYLKSRWKQCLHIQDKNNLRVLLEEKKLFIIPEHLHFNAPVFTGMCFSISVSCVLYYRSLFVLYLFAIVLSDLL